MQSGLSWLAAALSAQLRAENSITCWGSKVPSSRSFLLSQTAIKSQSKWPGGAESFRGISVSLQQVNLTLLPVLIKLKNSAGRREQTFLQAHPVTVPWAGTAFLFHSSEFTNWVCHKSPLLSPPGKTRLFIYCIESKMSFTMCLHVLAKDQMSITSFLPLFRSPRAFDQVSSVYCMFSVLVILSPTAFTFHSWDAILWGCLLGNMYWIRWMSWRKAALSALLTAFSECSAQNKRPVQ